MKELQKKNQKSLAQINQPPRGFEEIDTAEDIIFPRAKLLQALSPEVTETDLKAGQIINSLTKEVLPAKFIPIFAYKEWIRFNGRSEKDPEWVDGYEPAQIIWRTKDPNDPRVKEEGVWKDGTPPLAKEYICFFSIFEGQELPIIISFGKSSYKVGKQLLSLARFSFGDLFSNKYELGSKQIKDSKGTYYIFTVKKAGKSSKEEYKLAEMYWNEFAKRKEQIITDDSSDDLDKYIADDIVIE